MPALLRRHRWHAVRIVGRHVRADHARRVRPGIEGGRLPWLVNHDANNLLGRTASGTLRLSIDKPGLRYEIDTPNTTLGRDTIENIRPRGGKPIGDLSGSSFAFVATEVVWREQDRQCFREINAVKLYDVGPVVYPAYEASTTGLRVAGNPDDARADFDRWKKQRSTANGILARVAAHVRVLEMEQGG